MAKALVDGELRAGVCVGAEAGEEGVHVYVAARERGG